MAAPAAAAAAGLETVVVWITVVVWTGEVVVTVCAGAVVVTVSAGATTVRTWAGAVTVTGSPGIVSATVTVTGRGSAPVVVEGAVSMLVGTETVTPARVAVTFDRAAEPLPPPQLEISTLAITPSPPTAANLVAAAQCVEACSPIRDRLTGRSENTPTAATNQAPL